MRTKLKFIDPLVDTQWDQFIAEHPFGWVCHLSGWKKVIESSFKHMKGYYLTLQDENGIKGALPLFHVDSWLTGSRLVSIPYATLSDPLVSCNTELEQLVTGALDLLRKVHGKRIEIRSLLAHTTVEDKRLTSRRYYKHHYLHIDQEPELLKKRFHRSCIRQRIDRAESSDIWIKEGESDSDLQDFYYLYIITRKRLSLPPQPYPFFKALWDVFKPLGYLQLTTAYLGEKAIASLILLVYKDRASAEFLVSDERFRDHSPNHLLVWHAIKSARLQGCKIFDFGRTSPHNKPLIDFKRRWGTEAVDIVDFVYPADPLRTCQNREQTAQYRIVTKLCSIAPDPIFHAIGRFCYKHLG